MNLSSMRQYEAVGSTSCSVSSLVVFCKASPISPGCQHAWELVSRWSLPAPVFGEAWHAAAEGLPGPKCLENMEPHHGTAWQAIPLDLFHVPFGKRNCPITMENQWKSLFLMGKFAANAMFSSYVELPEGMLHLGDVLKMTSGGWGIGPRGIM